MPSDFEEYDYVLAMDEDNLVDLRDMVKRARKRGVLGGGGEGVEGKILLYGSFGGRSEGEEVVDPYYGGRDGFEVAYEQVERFGRGLLRHIEEEMGRKG